MPAGVRGGGDSPVWGEGPLQHLTRRACSMGCGCEGGARALVPPGAAPAPAPPAPPRAARLCSAPFLVTTASENVRTWPWEGTEAERGAHVDARVGLAEPAPGAAGNWTDDSLRAKRCPRAPGPPTRPAALSSPAPERHPAVDAGFAVGGAPHSYLCSSHGSWEVRVRVCVSVHAHVCVHARTHIRSACAHTSTCALCALRMRVCMCAHRPVRAHPMHVYVCSLAW